MKSLRKLRRAGIFWQARTAVRLFLIGMCLSSEWALAGATPLQISTTTQVSDQGKVSIALTLKNTGTRPLFHVHPMFHFHHTMSHMPMISKLEPQQSLTLKNDEHPSVVRVGSYPLVAVVSYKKSTKDSLTVTKIHTDTFSFVEPMISSINGRIDSEVNGDQSILKISLRNETSSFKNIRMMLLLPPGLTAENFKGQMGFTIRSGEEKYFEVPVLQMASQTAQNYPVHLLVEYGEMLNHYSGEIRGHIHFGPWLGRADFWPQMLVFVFLAVTLFLVLKRRAGVQNSIAPSKM